MPILFSDHFQIKHRETDGWFDPIIGRDTKLFIDPFLVQKLGPRFPEFRDAHSRAMRFFNHQFMAAAKLIDRNGQGADEIKGALHFPEVNELYLGYSKVGNTGAGSSSGFAKQLFGATLQLIDAGLGSVQRFEELALFGQGFGADRIGDMMSNLMKPALVAYTTRVCRSLGVPLTNIQLDHYKYVGSGVWGEKKLKLPVISDEHGERKPVLLVPKAFLRDLPTVDIDAFWHYSFARQNREIRRIFGQKVKKGIDREKIFELARTSEKLRTAFLENLNHIKPRPYDVERDPQLHHRWLTLGRQLSKKYPLSLSDAQDHAQFAQVIGDLIAQFKHFIEQRGGWRLLVDSKGRGRPEAVAQRLFDGIALSYCRANDIDYTPEANAGRGPVDFKFSCGFARRALLEIKLARNPKLIHGIEKQLPIYLNVDKIKLGYYVPIRFRADKTDNVILAQKMINKIAAKSSVQMHMIVVDAIKPKSASKAGV